MKKQLYLIALCLIILAGVWKWWATRNLAIRVPADWSFYAEYLGSIAYPDEHGNIPKEKTLNLYKRSMEVISWQPDQAIIEDIYTTHDIQTGAITYESKLKFQVDPQTGQVIDYKNHPEAKGLFYLFPQNSQKSNYTTFTYDLNPTKMVYDRTITREGIQLYAYIFSGVIDFTELYQESLWESSVAVPKDARLISPDFYREMWIEPVTGEIINIIEDDPGDYIMTADKSKSLGIFDVWSGKSTGQSIRHQLYTVKVRLWKLQFHRVWIPFGLMACALLLIVAAFLSGVKSSRRAPLVEDSP